MKPATHQGRSPFSVARFLVAMVLLFVSRPFFEQSTYGDILDVILSTLVLLSAVLAVGGRRRTLIIATILVVPSIVGVWWKHLHPHTLPRQFPNGLTILFVGYIVVHLFNFILRAPRVTTEVLCAGIANFLMLGLFWSQVDQLLARMSPGSFQFTLDSDRQIGLEGFLALYFSFGTLTTVAYGDIVPVTNTARMLAMLQAMTGMFYMAVIIARLVALYSTERVEEESSDLKSEITDSSAGR